MSSNPKGANGDVRFEAQERLSERGFKRLQIPQEGFSDATRYLPSGNGVSRSNGKKRGAIKAPPHLQGNQNLERGLPCLMLRID